ncbi:hypothetical protein [Wukongibacter sp. M2B1]|uniref:hypothetical protein n=1 Tax=Wukongibacter sp. M2B1 TaxID=3088895 RepID=UPI003D7BF059
MNIYKIMGVLYEKIEEITSDVNKYAEVLGVDREEAEADVDNFKKFKDISIGNGAARTYVINFYTKLLISYYNFKDEAVKEYIDFDDILNNDIRIIYELMLERYDIGFLIDKYELKFEITEEDFRKVAEIEEKEIRYHFRKVVDKVRIIATILYSIEDGQDVIDSLQYHNINEIGFNKKDFIWISYKSSTYYISFLSFKDEDILINIQKKSTARIKPQYSPENPIVVSNKDNSNRITVAGYISTPTDKHIYFNERIFNLPDISLEAMRDELRTIDGLIYDLTEINMEGKGKYLVTGADMGVGKTTFLVAMLGKCPNKWSIGIIDQQDETQADVKYPDKDIRMLIINPVVGIKETFEKALKMKREILNVGEIAAPEHAAELINVGLRLNSGVGGTLHSFTPYEVVTNCRNLMVRSDMYDSSEGNVAEADIARCMDLIYHLKRHPKNPKRIVMDKIVEIQYVEQEHFIEPCLVGSKSEKISRLLDMAQLALSKYLYRKNYRYNDIFSYDIDKDDWIPVNLPSDDYFRKMVETKFVSEEKIEKWKQRFLEKKRVI